MEITRGMTAVVTGAGNGIGFAISDSLARRGVSVVLADYQKADADAAARRIMDAGGRATAVRTDVADLESVRQLASVARDTYGPVDIVCNNAGVSLACRAVDATHQDWQWMVGVNLWGVIHGTEVFLPEMVASGRPGHIVNTASMNGLFPSAYSPMYSTTKFAVVGLTTTIRNELVGTQVGISVLCPAGVVTRIRESERSRPEELARNSPPPPHLPSSVFDLSPPLTADEVGEMTVSGITENRLYIFTDPKIRHHISAHYARMIEDFAPLDAQA